MIMIAGGNHTASKVRAVTTRTTPITHWPRALPACKKPRLMAGLFDLSVQKLLLVVLQGIKLIIAALLVKQILMGALLHDFSVG